MVVDDYITIGCPAYYGGHRYLRASGDGFHLADDAIHVCAADEEDLVTICLLDLMTHRQQCVFREVFMHKIEKLGYVSFIESLSFP